MTESDRLTPNKKNFTGSPKVGGPVYLAIGKLQRTHGVKGELIMEIYTEFPDRIVKGKHVFIGKQYKEYVIASVRPNAERLLVSFEGLGDCDQAAILRNQIVSIRTEDATELPEDQFYHHEIIGMSVFDESGVMLGEINEILETGANDVYVITPEGKDEILIPAIKSVIVSVDRKIRKMVVKLPEWE